MPKLSLIQTSCNGSPAENLDKTERLIRKAAKEGAQIVALQELFQTPYFCRDINRDHFKLAESIPGPVTDRISRIASEQKIVVLAPLFEKEAPGLYYNSLAVIDADGSLMGVYRKLHIPDDPGFHEKYYFTPGDRGYQVYQTKYGSIGTLICWDQWFPEAARITAMKGADLIVYPTAIATLPDEGPLLKQKYLEAWQLIQRSHAISNGCFIAGINRTGEEAGNRFWGHSFIAGPFGEILAEAGENEGVITAELDFSEIEKQRQIWPFFRDRRTDSYQDLLQKWIHK
jgi:N-carbamoylputrescine amidase